MAPSEVHVACSMPAACHPCCSPSMINHTLHCFASKHKPLACKEGNGSGLRARQLLEGEHT